MRTPDQHAIASAIIGLMRDVIYRETPSHEAMWATLQRSRAAVADHFSEIGIDLIVDETEGYAYLRTRETEDGEDELPRLVRRRSLTYNASLLLVLIRGRMAEFEAHDGDGKLVLTRDQLVELLRVFQASSTNEARIVDQADATIRQILEMGFLRELKAQKGSFEVSRVVKAYVDAQTMNDFASLLAVYARSRTVAGSEAQPAEASTEETAS